MRQLEKMNKQQRKSWDLCRWCFEGCGEPHAHCSGQCLPNDNLFYKIQTQSNYNITINGLTVCG